MRAFLRHNPFYVQYDMKGIDAELSDSAAVYSAGNAYGVIFDSLGTDMVSLPKGASTPDDSHTVALPCPKPVKLRTSKGGNVTCFKESRHFPE